MAEKQQTKRDALLERMKKRYPDKEYADDEALFEQIGADYDEGEAKIGKYEKDRQAMSDLFNQDYRSAAFLQQWKDGKDPAVALMEMFGDEIVDAINDPDKRKEIEEARGKYLKKLAESKKLDEEFEKNISATLSMLAEYQQTNGLSDEELDQAFDKVMAIAGKANMGIVEKESLDLFVKGMRHDADVAEAQTEGEIKGRNQKIEEKLRKPKSNDGMPVLASGGGAQQPKYKARGVFAEAEGAR